MLPFVGGSSGGGGGAAADESAGVVLLLSSGAATASSPSPETLTRGSPYRACRAVVALYGKGQRPGVLDATPPAERAVRRRANDVETDDNEDAPFTRRSRDVNGQGLTSQTSLIALHLSDQHNWARRLDKNGSGGVRRRHALRLLAAPGGRRRPRPRRLSRPGEPGRPRRRSDRVRPAAPDGGTRRQPGPRRPAPELVRGTAQPLTGAACPATVQSLRVGFASSLGGRASPVTGTQFTRT